MIVSYNSTCNLTLNMTNLNINHGLDIQLRGFPSTIDPFVLQDMSIYKVSFFVSSITLLIRKILNTWKIKKASLKKNLFAC